MQVSIKLLKEGMEIEARHVRRKQLSQYLDKELLNRERKNSESTTQPTPITAAKKRISTESISNTSSKKAKISESVSVTRYKIYKKMRV